jgi:hypothetical protein
MASLPPTAAMTTVATAAADPAHPVDFELGFPLPSAAGATTAVSTRAAGPITSGFGLPGYPTCSGVLTGLLSPTRLPRHPPPGFSPTRSLVADTTWASTTLSTDSTVSSAIAAIQAALAASQERERSASRALEQERALAATLTAQMATTQRIVIGPPLVDQETPLPTPEAPHTSGLDANHIAALQASLPASYWAEALHTATHLLNRLPSKAVSHPTPYFALYGTAPTYAHLRVFGCACYPNTSATAPHKLSPRSTRCLFLGYSSDHKGYRCLDLASHRIIISRHVVFDEDVFPLAGPSPPTDLDSLLESDPVPTPSQRPRLTPLPAPRAAPTPRLAPIPAPRAAPSITPAPRAAPSTTPAPCAAPPTPPAPCAAPSTPTARFADPALVYRRRRCGG